MAPEMIMGMMRPRGIEELMIVPIGADGHWDTRYDNRFKPVNNLDVLKSNIGDETDGIVLLRLRIIDDELYFHGAPYQYYVDGTVDCSCILHENPDDEWQPIGQFENRTGLIKIAQFLKESEDAWEYTVLNPDCQLCFLNKSRRQNDVSTDWY